MRIVILNMANVLLTIHKSIISKTLLSTRINSLKNRTIFFVILMYFLYTSSMGAIATTKCAFALSKFPLEMKCDRCT